jgi:hypothetical protein
VRETSTVADSDGITLAAAIAPVHVNFTQQVYSADPPKPSGFTLEHAAFCRLFYGSDIAGREGLWLGASVKSADQRYGDGYFMVQGLDLKLGAIAGTEKVLTDGTGTKVRAGGDTNQATDGRYFYAAAGGCGNASCTGVGGHATLHKFDRSWNWVAQHTFDFDNVNYRSNDMLFSYANRQLFFSIAHSENCGDAPNDKCQGGWTAKVEGSLLYPFSPASGAFAEPYTLGGDTASAMGGSLVYNAGTYWLVGNDGGPNALAAIGFPSLTGARTQAKPLAADGQWAQGAFFDDGRLFIAYHSGAHGYGDVNLVAWNADLTASSNTLLIDVDQTPDPKACAEGLDPKAHGDDCDTANPACAAVTCNGTGSACTECTGFKKNAQRPHLVRVRDTLYYTYDLAGETITATEQADAPDGRANWAMTNTEARTWECQVGAVALSRSAK